MRRPRIDYLNSSGGILGLKRQRTLTEVDIRQVLLCRGEQNRRSFALQLCLLRTYSRF